MRHVRKVEKRDLILELSYFLGLISISIYFNWKPHEIYLGYCIESANLILAGAILVLVRMIKNGIEDRNEILYFFLALVLLWFPFMFSTATSGIIELSNLGSAYDHNPLDFFNSYPKYLPWIAVSLLLGVSSGRELDSGAPALFSKAFMIAIRLFPAVLVALALASIPMSLTAKIIAFHLLLAFPYITLYRLTLSPSDSADRAEAKLSMFSLGFYVAILFILPFLGVPLACIGFGIALAYNGQQAGIVLAVIGFILLIGVVIGLRVGWKHLKSRLN